MAIFIRKIIKDEKLNQTAHLKLKKNFGDEMKKQNRTYTTQEVADLLGVSASSIQRWADSGKLLCGNTEGGHRKFSAEDLLKFANDYNIAMKFLEEHSSADQRGKEQFITQISASR